MDALAAVVVDVVLTTEKLPLTLNAVHPHRAAWRDVLHAVNAASGANLPFVPYKEWLGKLEEIAAQENSQETLEKIVSSSDGRYATTCLFTPYRSSLARYQDPCVLPRARYVQRPNRYCRGRQSRSRRNGCLQYHAAAEVQPIDP